MTQPGDISHALLLDRSKHGRKSRVITTPEHEVLPDQDTQLIAQVVENVLLPDAPTPYTITVLA